MTVREFIALLNNLATPDAEIKIRNWENLKLEGIQAINSNEKFYIIEPE